MGANLSTPTTLFSFNPTLHHKCKYWLNVCAHRADFMVGMKQFLWNTRGGMPFYFISEYASDSKPANSISRQVKKAMQTLVH